MIDQKKFDKAIDRLVTRILLIDANTDPANLAIDNIRYIPRDPVPGRNRHEKRAWIARQKNNKK